MIIQNIQQLDFAIENNFRLYAYRAIIEDLKRMPLKNLRVDQNIADEEHKILSINIIDDAGQIAGSFVVNHDREFAVIINDYYCYQLVGIALDDANAFSLLPEKLFHYLED